MLLDGVESIVVALLSCKAEVKYDPAVVLPKAISDAINTLGKFKSCSIFQRSKEIRQCLIK